MSKPLKLIEGNQYFFRIQGRLMYGTFYRCDCCERFCHVNPVELVDSKEPGVMELAREEADGMGVIPDMSAGPDGDALCPDCLAIKEAGCAS